MNDPTTLQSTQWLAKRLGLSLTTIERLRAKGGQDLPPHLVIGNSIRYEVETVEAWIALRLNLATQVKDEQHA